MIFLTRLNGQAFALNPDLVERADATPDTVVTLVDGTKYVVQEDLAELVRLVREHRAGVLLAARVLEEAAGLAGPEPLAGSAEPPAAAPVLRVVAGAAGSGRALGREER